MHKTSGTIITAVLLTLLFQPLRAQDTPWYEGVTLRGFTASSFTWNFNTPASGENGFRIFDKKHNSFSPDVFQLAIAKDAEKSGDAGFRADVITGMLPMYTASAGMFGSSNIDLLQAYASYVAPIGSGLRLDMGKFTTHMGYELIEGVDGYNDNISRSFLFGYAIPFAHTGLRARYAFSDAVSGMVMVANGWDNAVENNSNKTLGAQLAVAPMEQLSLFANVIHGTEFTNNNSDATTVMDFVAVWSLSELLSVGANVDLGSAAGAAAEGEDAAWTGFAGYVRLNLHEQFSLALRGEMFDDTDGVRTGVKQKLTEITVTPEFRPAEQFVIRADLRYDMSDQKVFEDGDSFENVTLENADSQFTFGLQMLFLF
jgi:hypothetical protein